MNIDTHAYSMQYISAKFEGADLYTRLYTYMYVHALLLAIKPVVECKTIISFLEI